ncbi:MAG: WG repeat-containing protein [Acidobacteriia bacterium]|nr:WG repeat-containing protein [Terriglobia bacterium]
MKAAFILGCLIVAVLPLLARAQNGHPSVREPLVVVQDGKYGYIDHNGAMLIPPQFWWGADFEHGFGAVYVCGRVVSVDASGNLVPLRARPEHELRPKLVGGKFGFVDGSGQFKIPAAFEDALPFSDGMAAVRLRDKWGFIDSTGRVVIPPAFEAAYYFREGVAIATTGGTEVLIDKTGKVLARGFKQLRGVTAERRVPVSRDEKYGYLDVTGTIAIPLVYDDADSFSEGLAPVKKYGKWGYIDRNGATTIPLEFDSAGVFGSGLAPVKIGRESGFIEVSGKFAFRIAFEYSPGFWGIDGDTDVSRFWTKDGAFGYVNTSGKVIWGPIRGSPDHAPILGWSEQDRVKSCEGVPDATRNTVAAFPKGDD